MAKILVIDDEKSIRNTLKDILETEEHEVMTAEDGAGGLELYRSDKFDVVLCDIKMQEMDGMEVLEKIMEDPQDVPVIMISGHGDIEIAVDAIKKGAFDFLEKPLDLNRLLITIRNALERSDLITETRVLKRRIAKTNDMIGESPAIPTPV
jgi:two-component system nitrogen regulation response regulator NtrX